MECWNTGILIFTTNTPVLHHSIIPTKSEVLMSNISGKYAIVGVAETKVGKRPDASTHSLHLECIKGCLDDAGIKASDVDGFITNQPLNDSHRSYAVRMANMAR